MGWTSEPRTLTSTSPWVLAASALLAACGGTEAAFGTGSPSGTSASAGQGGAAAVTSSGAGAGSSTGVGGEGGGMAECPAGELCLPEPEQGFQIRSAGETIQPGQDVEYCEVVKLPGDPSDTYYVKRFEAQMTQHSHHLIVVAAVPGSETEANMSEGDKVPCFTATTYGEEIIPVTGSQQPYREESFPTDVGRVFQGGQLLVFDYHYLNTTTEPLQARAAVNFHTVDASEVKRVAQDFGMFNLSINTLPGATSSFTKSCTFSQDVMVHKLTRHTHQWGTDFEVTQVGGDADGEHVFTSNHYEDVDHLFDEPVLMKAGTGYEFTCTFKNTTDKPLTFGVKATDEMCILFGTWFVPNVGDPVSDQGCFGL